MPHTSPSRSNRSDGLLTTNLARKSICTLHSCGAADSGRLQGHYGGRQVLLVRPLNRRPAQPGRQASSRLATVRRSISPHEYGTHWVGFGQRYGMRLTGVSTGNAIEATLGAAWGEDPRYFHTVHAPFKERVKNVVDLTFRAYHPDGERHLAYARYVATFGNNFLSNTWREPSEADWQHALTRTRGRLREDARSPTPSANSFRRCGERSRKHPDPYPADVHNP